MDAVISIFNFFSEKARGLLMTLVGAGVSEATPVIMERSATLDELQKWVSIGTLVVIALTIISYGYKFYKWCKNRNKS